MWREAEEFFLKDRYIGPLVKKWGHCTITPRMHADYYWSLVGAIIGQQLSGRVADVIEGRLKEKVKGKFNPENISALSDTDLRSCGMAWGKVTAIKDLSQRIVNNELKN